MAKKLLEIKNEFGNVTIDEQYSVPMLIMKGRVTTSSAVPPPGGSGGYILRPMYIDSYAWYGFNDLVSTSDLSDFGSMFEGLTPADDDAIAARVRVFNANLLTVARCSSGGYAILANGSMSWDRYNKKLRLVVTAYCELQNAIVDVAVYSTKHKKTHNFGMMIMNTEGEVMFDVLYPPMMFLGSMYGELSVWNDVAGTFQLDIPKDVLPDDCFITSMSGTPYYSAYHIHSGGVSWADTGFKSVMTFPSAGILRVDVVRQRTVPGTNSAFGYGGFFENVVYCPYPFGLYLDPSKL